MRERSRKREREFKDVASIMEAGGEGFIYDPIFKIKLGTTPILKNFKVRSYLNFMASLPMKRNPATGYFEFAETAEEMTALMKAYFWPGEPAALADAGYERMRINKAHHLLSQITANINAEGTEDNRHLTSTHSGLLNVNIAGPIKSNWVEKPWSADVVIIDEVSPGVITNTYEYIGVYVNFSAAGTIMIQTSSDNVSWYDHTELVFPAAGSKSQDIMHTPVYVRFKTLTAGTVTAEVVLLKGKIDSGQIGTGGGIFFHFYYKGAFVEGDMTYWYLPTGLVSTTLGEILDEIELTHIISSIKAWNGTTWETATRIGGARAYVPTAGDTMIVTVGVGADFNWYPVFT